MSDVLPTREEIADLIRDEAVRRHCTILNWTRSDFEGIADALLARLRPAWERAKTLDDIHAVAKDISNLAEESVELLRKENDALRADLRACAEALDPIRLAPQFHEAYERLAPLFGYATRAESAKPWTEVPEQNRALMEAVIQEVFAPILARPGVRAVREEK